MLTDKWRWKGVKRMICLWTRLVPGNPSFRISRVWSAPSLLGWSWAPVSCRLGAWPPTQSWPPGSPAPSWPRGDQGATRQGQETSLGKCESQACGERQNTQCKSTHPGWCWPSRDLKTRISQLSNLIDQLSKQLEMLTILTWVVAVDALVVSWNVWLDSSHGL